VASPYWFDRVYEKAVEARQRMRATMQGVVSRPVLRRPNTKTLLEATIRDPASVDPSGREALAGFLFDTYGESAQAVIPYLGLEGEEEGF
jgi:hypothetical protein